MDRTTTIWQRLERYRQELIDQCDRANRQMDHNRRIRETWHARTLRWKKTWLGEQGEQKLPKSTVGKEPGGYPQDSPDFPFL